jgi:hypothetical protein
MKGIQELIAYFERRGRFTPEELTKLRRQGFGAEDAPHTMVGLCDQPGQTYYFRVTGQAAGNVWGTDVYTGDSDLAVAAVHAGAVKLGETGVVKVTVVPALSSYHGSTRNGIATQRYGHYPTAYRVDPV